MTGLKFHMNLSPVPAADYSECPLHVLLKSQPGHASNEGFLLCYSVVPTSHVHMTAMLVSTAYDNDLNHTITQWLLVIWYSYRRTQKHISIYNSAQSV
jgi:hypothetical protein